MAKKGSQDIISVSSEALSSCQKRFDFTIKQADLKKESGNVIRYFASMVSIPGFRRGKAPENIVLRKHEKDVMDELKMRLYSQAFEKLQKEEKLDIVSSGAPVEKAPLKLDADYVFSFTVDLAPEFELPEYKGVKVEVAPAEVSDEAVNERIKYYCEMYAAYEDIDTPAAKEDMLKVSYTSDFELPEDAAPSLVRQVQANENWLWLNEPEMIPGVIAAMTGAEKGKDYEFTAEYPADWRETALAGKKVTYKVKVIGVQRRKTLTEAELCEKMKVENSDKLREMMKSALAGEADMKRRGELREAVFAKVAESIPEFEMPGNLMNAEIDKEIRRLANTLVKKEEDVEEFKKNLEAHKAEAEQAAKAKLRRLFICRKIADKEGIKVERNEVDAQLKGMSKYYGYKEKELRAMLEKNGAMEDIQLDIMVGKVTDFLVDKADVAK